MLTATEIAGFAGAGLAGAAYVPQISHLIRARCSAGISRLAFEVWLLASLLTTVRAIAIHAGVFIALGGIQIAATALIMLFATRYKGVPCPIHLPAQPTAAAAWHKRMRANAARTLPFIPSAVHLLSNDVPERGRHGCISGRCRRGA
jgi:PQ loop repeat protein